MNSVVGSSTPSNRAPNTTLEIDGKLAPQALDNNDLKTPSRLPSAGNSSGLLTNFVLPKSSLDALGLLKPSNQGDSEVLASQVSLVAEELATDSNSAEAEANAEAAEALSAFLQGVSTRIAELRAQNDEAQGRIQANSATIDGLDAASSGLNTDLAEVTAEIGTLNAQIATLQASVPVTQDVAQQIQELTRQVQDLTTQAGQIQTQISEIQAQKAGLQEQITADLALIAANDGTIAAQAQNAVNSIFALAALREEVQSPSESIEAAQSLFLEEIVAQDIEEFLPNMQVLFEADFEDAQIQEMIAETGLTDEEAAKAIAISYGLVGSFYEGLGVFLQQANLVELDLDSVARANNESQRLQIPL